MKSIIRKLLRESLMGEDFDSSNELNDLSEEIYKEYCKKLAGLNPDKMGELPMIHPFNIISDKDFPNLSEFMNGMDLGFQFRGLPENTNGIFISKKSFDFSGRILIANGLEELIEHFIKTKDIDNQLERYREIYFKTHDENVISTILHELQHAYDIWRSEGNFMNNKKTRKFVKDKSTTDSSEVRYTNYLRLPHEISARFEQAIKKIKFFDYDWYGDNRKIKIMTPWDELYESFKSNFFGWDEMTPKIQKNLTRRVAQYYHKFQDKINTENKNINNEKNR